MAERQPDQLSPLGYVYRNCTDFVAWRLNRDAGITTAPWKYTWANLTPLGGNAIDWKTSWIANGWTTSHIPIPGAVAYWGKSGGSEGHVAYVQAVNLNNTVTLEEYNWGGTNKYDTRTIDARRPRPLPLPTTPVKGTLRVDGAHLRCALCLLVCLTFPSGRP